MRGVSFEPIKVLDHGLVRLVDYMGSDLSISRSARVSYDAPGREEDKGLINYLLTNGHNTPFEACEIMFEIKAPIFVFRQWHRHRTQSYNELSARYRELPEEFYVPELDQITMQSEDNKQMRTEEQHPEAQMIADEIASANRASFQTYKHLLREGAPRELARSVLPVGAYSHMFAKANLFNWMRFMKERSHPHAQYEIRVYADVILSILSDLFPLAIEAFMDKYEHVNEPEPVRSPRSCGDCRNSRMERTLVDRQFKVGCAKQLDLPPIELGDLDELAGEQEVLEATFKASRDRATSCDLFERHRTA